MLDEAYSNHADNRSDAVPGLFVNNMDTEMGFVCKPG